MSLKATIYKANIQLADMDRHIYDDYDVTMARHPSETDERMIVRLLVFALNVPPNDQNGMLEFGKDLWEPDDPVIFQKDLTGQLVQWIDIGQPDDRRMMKASTRAQRVSVYSYSASTPIWWGTVGGKVTRARNLSVWQLPSDQVDELAGLAKRTMRLQVTVQDESIWVGDGTQSIEITPKRLMRPSGE